MADYSLACCYKCGIGYNFMPVPFVSSGSSLYSPPLSSPYMSLKLFSAYSNFLLISPFIGIPAPSAEV